MTDLFRAVDRHLYLDGRLQGSAATTVHDVVDPATEERYGAAAEATPEEIDTAIAVANRVQPHWWRAHSGLERAQKLHAVAAALKDLQPTLAEALTREMGKPYKEAVDEVSWTISAFDYYAEIARNEQGRIYAPSMAGQLHCSIKEPLGVAVLILPYNFPLLLLAWQAAAALGAGNAVIIKPSEITSLCTLRMMEAFAPLPAGLAQCVTGGPGVARRLLESADTHCAAFTGTIAAGRVVGRICGERFKPVLMETSGNDPFLVMPSAPLDIAVRGAAFASFLNCGQVCTAAERLYVHDRIYDAFADRLAAEARRLRIGNGLDRVDLGPMATRAARDRYEAAAGHRATTAAGSSSRPSLPACTRRWTSSTRRVSARSRRSCAWRISTKPSRWPTGRPTDSAPTSTPRTWKRRCARWMRSKPAWSG
jgi:betaine-aldehyde dehydrogenase